MKFKKIISGAISAAILCGMLVSAKAEDVAGWSEFYSYGPDVTAGIDRTTKGSDACFYIDSRQPLKADCYYQLSTAVHLEQGKTYIYGADVKAKDASGAYIQIDWVQRTSMLAHGSTFDWTTIGRKIDISSTGDYSLIFIVDREGKIWLDNVYCYEYKGGKKVGENLVKNSSFGVTVQQKPNTTDTPSADDEAGIAASIKSSDTFRHADLEKAYGGGKFIPAYPAENITIDGKISEWSKYPAVKLPTLSSQYCSFGGKDYDAYGYFRFAYDDENLYISAQIHDNVFYPVNDTEAYWMSDTIQLALSKAGETFGKELTFGVHDNGTFDVFGSDGSVVFKATQNNDKTVTDYEMAIPWKFSYGSKPDFDLLMTALYNDNDGKGRTYCAEWSPGISLSKNNAEYPHLRLIDWNEDFAWFDGSTSIQNQSDNYYDFYYVNTSDTEKQVHIDIPAAEYREDVTVSAKSGIRRKVNIIPKETGTLTFGAEVTSGGECVSKIEYTATVEANISRYNDEYFAQKEAEIKEIEKLIKQCEEKNIPVKYEKINLTLLKKFLPNLKSIKSEKNVQISRVELVGRSLDDLYAEAKTNLSAYLSGEKKAKDVPTYVTSRIKIENDSIVGNAEWNDGTIEERPLFFTGYGHFGSATGDIEKMNSYGANAIQTELGISSILKKPGSVTAFSVSGVGSFPAAAELSNEDKAGGEYSMKISCPQSAIPNNYKTVDQSVTVKPNTTYKWGLSAKGKNVGGQMWFSNSGWANTHSLSGTYDWKNFEYEYTTGPEEVAFNFFMCLADSADYLYIDDIYLKENGVGKNLIRNGDFESNGQIIGDSCVDTDAVAAVEDKLKRAEESNVSVCLLLSPHYFPAFLTEKYPELKAKVSHFIGYDIMNEKAIEATKLYIDTLIPRIIKYKSLGSICLTNEPQNTGKYEQMAPWWRTYLYNRYAGDINALNEAFGTKYSNFDQIPISGSADNSQEVNQAVDWEHVEETEDENATVKYTESVFSLEWNRFNDKLFAEYHKILADEVHKYAPDMPVHSKVMAHDTSTGVGLETSDGTDYELFGEFSDMHGNDAWKVFTTSGAKEKGGFNYKSVMYEEQRSTKSMPVFNTEDHILYDGEKYWGYEQAKHIYTDMWQGAVHGRDGSVIWLWEYTSDQTSSFYGLIHSRPDAIKNVGYANYNMNRLAYELTALQHAEPTVGVIRSKISKTYTPNQSIYMISSSCLMAGQKFDSIVDNQIEDIHKYKVIFLPELTHVSERTLSELEKYADNGGKLVCFGKNILSKNEYDKPNDAARVSNILKNAVFYESLTDWEKAYDIIQSEVKNAGLMRVELIDADTGDTVKNIEWQSTEYNGKLLVNICNYNWYEPKNVIIKADGKEVSESMDLISGEKRDRIINLVDYEPQLIQIG